MKAGVLGSPPRPPSGGAESSSALTVPQNFFSLAESPERNFAQSLKMRVAPRPPR